eukprot:GEMP01000612.1.p1 GENE.GEMP01000612.1~~GEMP01000612.1.p1  ORF type:complete len:1893 (+),score=526.37 GEMP01000612.1:201-5879(+)
MGKVRVELAVDFGPKKGHIASGIIVQPHYDAIYNAALNKFKLPKKNHVYALYMRDKHAGMRFLPASEKDLSTLLRDGVTIVVASSYIQTDTAGNARRGDENDAKTTIQPPPKSATWGSLLGTTAEMTEARGIRGPPCDMFVSAKVACEDEWSGRFPVLAGNVLPLVRTAIAGVEGFIQKDCGRYIAFDYHAKGSKQLEVMFADPESIPKKGSQRWRSAVRRECRGLLVDVKTGHVLARRFPKFFNVNEFPESQQDRLSSLPGPFQCTEKLDGSMCSPLVIDGQLRWATKAILGPRIEAFVRKQGICSVENEEGGAALHSKSAETLSITCLEKGLTPIFEWCDVGSPVGVIGHDVQRLVLVAIREIESGAFWEYEAIRQLAEDHNVEVVKKRQCASFDELVATTSATKGEEGVVVQWPSGLLAKVKTKWWTSISAASRRSQGTPGTFLLDIVTSQRTLVSLPAYIMWRAVFSWTDGEKAAIYTLLPPTEQAHLRAFEAALHANLSALDNDLHAWAASLGRDIPDTVVASLAGRWPLHVLNAYRHEVYLGAGGAELRTFLQQQSGNSHTMTHLLELCWTSPSACEKMTSLAATLDAVASAAERCGELDAAPPVVITHVLETYLPARIKMYLGTAEDLPMARTLLDSTPVYIARTYMPSEGKIRDLWERFEYAPHHIINLRIDVQPCEAHFSAYYGDRCHALLLVQFGALESSAKAGRFAGVLWPTETHLAYSHLHRAMERSFATRRVCKVDAAATTSASTGSSPASPDAVSEIFLDLVVVDFEAGLRTKPAECKVWQYISGRHNYFEWLPWTRDGFALWQFLHSLDVPVTVLTGVPDGSLGLRSTAEKTRWCHRELHPDIPVQCTATTGKGQWSAPGKVLIDDRVVEDWNAHGGRQIVHTSAADTMEICVLDLGLGTDMCANMEDVEVITEVTAAFQQAAAEASILAVDVEWVPDTACGAPHSASIMQLAFSRREEEEREEALLHEKHSSALFVVDVANWSEGLKQCVTRLLSEESVLKVVFGVDGERRIPGFGTRRKICPAVDLKQAVQNMSLERVAARCGFKVKRDTHIQYSDWSQRPLRDEQILYAAAGALTLLRCYDRMTPHPVAPSPLSCGPATAATGDDLQNSGPIDIHYTGIFLQPASRKKLLAHFPPRLTNVIADHMTIAHAPSVDSLRGLDVGRQRRLEIVSIAFDDQAHAVGVRTCDEENSIEGHITIATRLHVPPKHSKTLAYVPLAQDDKRRHCVLDGIVGLQCAVKKHAFGADCEVPERDIARARALAENGLPNQSEIFPGLTSVQRRTLHELASQIGLCSHSEGKKNSSERKLFLTVPSIHKQLKPEDGDKSVGWTVQMIKTKKMFTALFGASFETKRVHACMTARGLEWASGATPAVLSQVGSSGSTAAAARVVVIMRGFPGCGKSGVARSLHQQCRANGTGSIICSADDFWTSAEPDDIARAHDECRALFNEHIELNTPLIIVDNTNVRKKAYQFYADTAEQSGYTVVILEMICATTRELEWFRKRSSPIVPGHVVGNMWQRWVVDNAAVRIAPYKPDGDEEDEDEEDEDENDLDAQPARVSRPDSDDGSGEAAWHDCDDSSGEAAWQDCDDDNDEEARQASDNGNGGAVWQNSDDSSNEAARQDSNNDNGGAAQQDIDDHDTCEHPSVTLEPLWQWIGRHKLLNRRPYTHIAMDCGTRDAQTPESFLSIPPSMITDFHAHYMHDLTRKQRHYWVEIVSHPECIQLFFDLHGVSSTTVLLRMLHVLQQHVLPASTVPLTITGTHAPPRAGFHVFAKIRASIQQARAWRDQWVSALEQREENSAIDGLSWAEVIDHGVYGCPDGAGSAQLRLLGSRKCADGVDGGRVHEVLFQMTADGKVVDNCTWEWSDVSIRWIHEE